MISPGRGRRWGSPWRCFHKDSLLLLSARRAGIPGEEGVYIRSWKHEFFGPMGLWHSALLPCLSLSPVATLLRPVFEGVALLEWVWCCGRGL